MLRKLMILFGTAMLIGACQPQSGGPGTPPALTFTRFQPIYMDVSQIEVIEEYRSPMRAPNVEHLLPYSPSEAMHIWTKDRLNAVGMDKSLQVIVKEGSVIAYDMPKPDGVKGLVSLGKDKRYEAKLDVELRIYDGGAMSVAHVAVAAARSLTIPERASVSERDAIFRKLMFDLMESVNAELEKNIFKYFSNYISYSHTP